MSTDVLPLVRVSQRNALGPEQISGDKLLALARKDDLMDFLGLDQYRGIERFVKQNNQGRFKLKDMKDFIKSNKELSQQFLKSKEAGVMYKRYLEKVEKQNSNEGLQKQLKQKQASAIMKDAKKKYIGCLATRIDPEIYEDCLDDYNNPNERYEQYGIVPNAIRQSQMDYELANQHPQRAAVLKLPDNAKINYLPRGIRQFIDAHPTDFQDYLREIKAEGKYLDAIKKAMRNERDINQRDIMRKRLMQALEGEIEDEEEI